LRCKRTGRLYAFLRRHRHLLFDEEFESELAEMYADSPLGKPPVPPAMLAAVTILQAVEGVSDAGAVEEAMFDRRWQMVLDCSGATRPPFSQGVLVDFRLRLMTHGLHERLVERSVQVAKDVGGFGFKQLRLALDSAPLWGAGRVEDTFNLIGHALEVVVLCCLVPDISPGSVPGRFPGGWWLARDGGLGSFPSWVWHGWRGWDGTLPRTMSRGV